MGDSDKPNPTTLRKRRGVVRASITRLATRLKDLETKVDQPTTLDLAHRMSQKLDSLDSEFKVHHYALVDIIDDDDLSSKEQETLDEHDDEIAELAIRIKKLISLCTATPDSNFRKVATRKQTRISKGVAAITEAIGSLTGSSDDVCLLHQYEEQLRDYKKDLSDIRDSLLSQDLDESDELYTLQAKLEKEMFDCSLQIKKLLLTSRRLPESTPTPDDGKGVKLPKIDVPKFDGNIVNWKTFWEQFYVSIHSRSNLSDSEKLVYLRHSLKDGSAKNVIEGLSRSGEYYAEAVESLKARYDRPRLIHQTHVRMILEAAPLKEGTGRELRRLYDTVQQHLRALKAMDYEPSGPFITSILELKLDTNTMFEWQKHSQDSTDVPHYQKLLEFVNLRAQASEASISDHKRTTRHEEHSAKKTLVAGKPIASFTASATPPSTNRCILCNVDKHPLYACSRFKALNHEQMVSTLKSHNLCLNCLQPGHFVRQCKSLHRCKVCQRPHHTLLHIDTKETNAPSSDSTVKPVSSNAAAGLASSALLMTCRVLVDAPDGSSVEARAILDSASSASFVSERLSQTLCLPRSHQNTKISGVAGLSHNSPLQTIANFRVSDTRDPTKKHDVTAIVVPRVTCDLPLHPIPFNLEWNHLADIPLADPDFGRPGRIDILLGVDVFVEVLRQGRRIGAPGSPSAFETDFGWVLAGNVNSHNPTHIVTSYHTSVATGDEILRKFWEIEERPNDQTNLSPEERSVMQHFEQNHSRGPDGRFIVPLPKRQRAKPFGETRSQAVRRFLSLERSLHSKGQFEDFNAVMTEYFEMGHAEAVPAIDLKKPTQEVFYLPMHSVRKESSTTTKLRAVFDASAKSSTGTSLNDTLLVGPTIHPPLVDVLLRFRLYRIALTTDVSKMYRAIELVESDRDLHRFVWRSSPSECLQDFRMTRVTFGVSASSFAANMAVKQNANDFALDYPQAANVVDHSFYVDDGLTGADSPKEAIDLYEQLQALFSKGGFLLRKWNSSDASVLQHIPCELRDSQSMHLIPDSHEYVKTLGIEWNASADHFRLTIADLPPLEDVTKRVLVSDIAKTFDVLGWFSPCIIKVKILLQQLWESKVDWDDPIPIVIRDVWLKWRSELSILSTKHIPRCYFSKETKIASTELHGFCDASEQAYAAVVYLRMTDTDGNIQIALVTSKTKVAPIKRLTIPRLELCGAQLLARLLHHTKQVFNLPLTQVSAWTDSTIVLNWLVGDPRRFKTYVGNRVSCIVELIGPDRWKHVQGIENPADCASRGLFPSELLDHALWWNGPAWLRMHSSAWPHQSIVPDTETECSEETSLHAITIEKAPIVPMDRYSSFIRLKRVTAWVLRFTHNCRTRKTSNTQLSPNLTTVELQTAETYWLSIIQQDHFAEELNAIKQSQEIRDSSALLPLHPILDSSGLLRVGGRARNSTAPFSRQHPVILHGKHSITRLIVRSEHLRLLHAGPSLLMCSLNRLYHITGCRKVVRTITRGCITCRRIAAKPQAQLVGQLPTERVTPDLVFDKVGVDYAGPVYVKYGSIRKPTVVKAYICVFVSMSVKAVHLELVSDLTSEAFIACLRRFISRRGKPSLIWSDHGTNFVGAAREIRELIEFLETQKSQTTISEFCSSQNIQWKFIPEHAPHFGGLWEAAVKSLKNHLKRVVANVKLTFEEFATVLAQVEACLNSRPLVSLPCDDDGVEALTPGHFLIGRPMEALPDPSFSYRSLSLLRRWHLCQALVRQFWQRWSTEYISSLRRFAKWHHPSKNLNVGDVVVLHEDNVTPTKWPLARIVEVRAGKDGLVRVVTVKTSSGTYTRPITKVALLLPSES